MPYSISLDYEPLIVLEITGNLTDADLVAMNAEVTLAMRKHASLSMRTAVVLDFSKAGPISPSQRKIIGQWRTEVRELTKKVSVGMAMVVKSPVIRGVLTAISWFQAEPVPVVYVDSFEEGVDWVLMRCAVSQIDVPSHVRVRLQARSSYKLRALGR
jgi:hypothetical protein